ncbi:unnamed protein product [Urochloa decumbens]|uniref:Bifunctional inhibitor/plant lipid transfer protein/seed storage helical domain-containing protein n=1 Tax=Urochloa decumbens TaxID=240449 RepID=A0ABC8XXW7_9POAL
MAKAVAVLAAALLVVVAAMRAGGAPPPPPPPPCDSSNLSSCAGAFLFGFTPSPTCCTKLKEEEQKGCLCLYANDPQYSGYLNSTTARNALAKCGVAYPTGC